MSIGVVIAQKTKSTTGENSSSTIKNSLNLSPKEIILQEGIHKKEGRHMFICGKWIILQRTVPTKKRGKLLHQIYTATKIEG